MNLLFCYYSGAEGLGYKYSHTVNKTEPLINLIWSRPYMELSMPILDCDQETLDKIFKHLNEKLAEKTSFHFLCQNMLFLLRILYKVLKNPQVG